MLLIILIDEFQATFSILLIADIPVVMRKIINSHKLPTFSKSIISGGFALLSEIVFYVCKFLSYSICGAD